jgi:hypothetical protein
LLCVVYGARALTGADRIVPHPPPFVPDRMFFLRIPFHRWPLHQHALLAGMLVGAGAMVGGWHVQRTAAGLATVQQEGRLVQGQLAAAQAASPQAAAPADMPPLPSISRADEVARDVGRFAKPLGVQITSLTVSPHASTSTELAKVQFNVAAQADYKTGKAWLAQLLARYPTLVVQSLSMRALANDAPGQELRLSLVLWVND